MRLDPDFALDLLRKLADSEDIYTPLLLAAGPRGQAKDQRTAFHVLLLEDAGLITRRFGEVPNGPTFGRDDFPGHMHGGHRLTFRGVEFVAMAENKELWETAKKEAKKAGGGGSLETILRYLFEALKIAVPILMTWHAHSHSDVAK